MRALVAILLLATKACSEASHTFLVSVVDLPLGKDESVEKFSFATWGVEFKTVCHIPAGWRISAGGSATPEGELAGTGSLGATWLSHRSRAELQDLALVSLSGPVQANDAGSVPATFKGTATISTDTGDRTVSLTIRNVKLSPAANCPT